MKTLDCGHPSEGAGYTPAGKSLCYVCCAERDKQYMRDHGKITLYLTHEKPFASGLHVSGKVINWPGTLSIDCKVKIKQHGHNWGITRYDAWFIFEGATWHGVGYGENSQLIRCKKTK